MVSRRKYTASLIVMICLFGAIFHAVAQNDSLPPLSPISAANVENLTELHRIGRGWIHDIDLSPDGGTLAVAGSLGVWLYDAQNLQTEPELLTGETGSVMWVVFSPGGPIAAFYADEYLLRLWDVSTKTVIATLNDVWGNPVFSPDGRWLAYSTKDQTIQLWDVENKKIGLVLTGHEDVITGIAFSPDSTLLASQGRDAKLRIWDVAAGVQLDTLESYGNRLMFSPDGSLLAFLDVDRVVIWNLADQKEQLVLDNLPGNGMDLAFSPDGSRLATANEYFYGTTDNAVKVWDVGTGKQLASMGKATLGSVTLAWAPDGQSLFIGSEENVQKWDVERQSQTDSTADHFSSISSMSLSPDETLIAASYSYGKIRVFDAHTFMERAAFGGHTIDDEVFKVVFSPDSSLLAALSDPLGISRPNKLSVWDIATQTELWKMEANINDIAFSPDGNVLAISLCEGDPGFGCESGSIQLWDVATHSQHKALKVEGDICHVTFHPNGNLLAAAGQHTVNVWDAASGDEVFSATYPALIRNIGYGASEILTFTSMPDDTSGYPVSLWNAVSGEALSAQGGFQGQLWLYCDNDFTSVNFVFSHDGSSLVSNSSDYRDGGVLYLWDTSTRTQIGQLDGHTTSVSGVRLSQNEERLWSGSSDGTIRLWGVPATL